MTKRLTEELIAAYQGNKTAKIKVASLYFNGTGGSIKNHHAAYEIFSDLQAHDKSFVRNDDTNLCLGLYAYLNDRKDEAVTYLSRVPAKKLRADILFILGNWAYDHKRYTEAVIMYRGFLDSYSDHYPDLVDFVKNRGLSSTFYMKKKREFCDSFIIKANVNSPVSEENISHFCKCAIYNWESVHVLERICIDDRTKKEIAQKISDYYLNHDEPRPAIFWAKQAKNRSAIKQLKLRLDALSGKHFFFGSLTTQLYAISHSLMLFFAVPIWICLQKNVNTMYIVCAYCALGVFMLNLLRYLLFKEEKKLIFFLRVLAISLIVTAWYKLWPDPTAALTPGLAIFYAISFVVQYAILYFMEDTQLANLEYDTTRCLDRIVKFVKDFIRSFE